jgi:hypothetical protein
VHDYNGDLYSYRNKAEDKYHVKQLPWAEMSIHQHVDLSTHSFYCNATWINRALAKKGFRLGYQYAITEIEDSEYRMSMTKY